MTFGAEVDCKYNCILMGRVRNLCSRKVCFMSSVYHLILRNSVHFADGKNYFPFKRGTFCFLALVEAVWNTSHFSERQITSQNS